ncbi:MAG: GspJ family T2SS minor pseudopilin variant LspJ [Legionellales bacterium]
MKPFKGFTLIEILIALTVFAILASITSSALYHAFSTRARVNSQADQLNALQMAISIIEQDTIQIVDRGVRGTDMHPVAAFIGQAKYLEFTRDGVINPKSKEKRSTLKRVALVCEGGQLLHRTWISLDAPNRTNFEDKILLEQITHCYFNYLDHSLQPLTEWHDQALTQNQTKEPFPKAIQVNLTLKEWGEMNMLFIIPGAVYGAP